jgi:hypothetical protein
VSTPREFTLNLSAFVAKAKSNADACVRKIVLDMGTRIVLRSPVGDGKYWKSPPPKGYIGGRFRANWQYGAGVIPGGTLSAIDRNGGATISKIAQAIPFAAAGMIHYLTNNLPYAMRLEYGWSRQAPAGMVAITVVEYQTIVRNAAAAINK